LSPTGRQATTALGAVAVEVGEGQAGPVGDLLRDAGFAAIEARRDLAGIERVVIGER
jgi:release factor glutamine methyltransferase